MIAYNLQVKVNSGYICERVTKCMYWLPQSGRISHDDLVQHLAIYGYHSAKTAPVICTHEIRPITFTLVVNNFGIKHSSKKTRPSPHGSPGIQIKSCHRIGWKTLCWYFTRLRLQKGNIPTSRVIICTRCTPFIPTWKTQKRSGLTLLLYPAPVWSEQPDNILQSPSWGARCEQSGTPPENSGKIPLLC